MVLMIILVLKISSKNPINPISSVNWLNLIGIVTAGFFGLAIFENNGKLTGLWGFLSASVTTYVFLKLGYYSLMVLYAYETILDFILIINGGHEEKKTPIKKTVIELTIVLIIGLITKFSIDGFKFELIYILELFASLLTACGQILMVKQSILQFGFWIPKNAIELVLGIISANPAIIARNIYFSGMNIFSIFNWNLQKQERKKEERKTLVQKEHGLG